MSELEINWTFDGISRFSAILAMNLPFSNQRMKQKGVLPHESVQKHRLVMHNSWSLLR